MRKQLFIISMLNTLHGTSACNFFSPVNIHIVASTAKGLIENLALTAKRLIAPKYWKMCNWTAKGPFCSWGNDIIDLWVRQISISGVYGPITSLTGAPREGVSIVTTVTKHAKWSYKSHHKNGLVVYFSWPFPIIILRVCPVKHIL